MSMRYLARTKDAGLPPVHRYDSVWDSEMIHGCVCDKGFTGFDCSERA
jgi:hypothetical protein